MHVRLTVFVLVMVLASQAGAQSRELRRMTDDAFIGYVAGLRTGSEPHRHGTQALPGGSPCGFDVTLEIARRLATMPPDAVRRLQSSLTPAQYDTSILSPSGRFRIHFDTTGVNTPALLLRDSIRLPNTAYEYARAVAGFFDSAYTVEVEQIGYQAPPFEDGTTAYNVYLREYTSDYGRTFTITKLPSQTLMPIYTSDIEMDNDYAGNFYTKGLNGARVTAAHEFHHMVQLGSYGAWFSEQWMHEMTSTFFEDVVYHGINDYFQYLPDFFNFPERSLYGWDTWGYPLVPFPKLMEKKYGQVPLRTAWEMMRKEGPIQAIDDALRAAPAQSDLGSEFCSLARWMYATGYRWWDAAADARFTEGAAWPRVKFAVSIDLNGSATLSGAVPPLATQFLRIYKGPDTAVIAVTNIDVQSAARGSMAANAFSVDVRDAVDASHTPIGNGWSYALSSAAQDALCVTVFARGAIPNRHGLVAPNPFHPAQDGVIRFTIGNDVPQTRASLRVFTAAMDLVYHADNADIRTDPSFGRFIPWNGVTDDGASPATGVYFFAMQYGDTTVTGKFAIVGR